MRIANLQRVEVERADVTIDHGLGHVVVKALVDQIDDLLEVVVGQTVERNNLLLDLRLGDELGVQELLHNSESIMRVPSVMPSSRTS